jgi:hypothetical protein
LVIELSDEYAPVDNSLDSQNEHPHDEDEMIAQDPDFLTSTVQDDSMVNLLDVSIHSVRDASVDIDASPIDKKGSPIENSLQPATVDGHHRSTSPDHFVKLIRDNDQAPARETDSPLAAGQEFRKSLQSDFVHAVREDSDFFSADFSKRVLFKETSNEVRFFSRTDSELDLFKKRNRISVRTMEAPDLTPLHKEIIISELPKESTYSPPLIVDDDETSSDILNLMSKNWKSFEKSAVGIKDSLTSWSTRLNSIPDKLCSADRSQLGSIPLTKTQSLRGRENWIVDEDYFDSIERSWDRPPRSAPKEINRQESSRHLATPNDNPFDTGEQVLAKSESTEIMLREVKGKRFVAFGENENAIPLGSHDQPSIPLDRKKTVVDGARRWAKTQSTPSPRVLSVELVNDDRPVPKSLDHPLLWNDAEEQHVDTTGDAMQASPVQYLSRRPASSFEISTIPEAHSQRERQQQSSRDPTPQVIVTTEVGEGTSEVSAKIDFKKASAFFKEFSQHNGGFVHSRTVGNR